MPIHPVALQSSGPGATGSPLPGYASVPPYTLADLHADLNRWPAAYYSKQVRGHVMGISAEPPVFHFPAHWTPVASLYPGLIKYPVLLAR